MTLLLVKTKQNTIKSKRVISRILVKSGSGPQGRAATVSVGTVETVENGQPPTIENVGTATDAILNFGIPEGDKGDKGDTGEGIAPGGAVGQYLRKQSATDFDTSWQSFAISTIPGLQTSLDSKATNTALNAHITNTSNPHNTTKAQVGLANADNTSDLNKPISNATQNALDDKADLVDGKVPESQLPAYVDDVLVFDNVAAFPAVGEDGKIYIAEDTNLTYRWTGTAYAEISPSLALGETSSTAYRGDRGKIAYDHSLLTNNPHGVTPTQIGLGNVNNTSDANKPISTAVQSALNTKLNQQGTASTVYGVNGSSTQVQIAYSTTNANNSLALRTSTGQVVGSDPTAANHLTTKSYTDAALATKSSLLSIPQFTVPYRSLVGSGEADTSLTTAIAPTASSLAYRTASGEVRTATPTVNDAATPKSYVDTGLDGKATKVSIPQFSLSVRAGAGSGEPDATRSWAIGATVNTFAFRDTDGTLQASSPTINSHLTTKGYVDTALTGKVGTSGDETIGGRKTFTLLPIFTSDPVASNHAVRKQYVDDQITALTGSVSSTYVKLAGDNMTGTLNTSGALVARGDYPSVPTVAGVYLGTPSTLNPRFTIVPTSGSVRAIDNGAGALRFINSTSGTVQLISSTDGMFTLGSGNTPTHTLTLPSTNTGISSYNTSDQTTNFERVRMFWNGGVFSILNEIGGTGVARSIRIGIYSGGLFVHSSSSLSQGFIRADQGLVNASQSIFSINGTMSVASGSQVAQVIAPVISQSGTASYTALLINPTETTTGSGVKTLIEAQVGGVSRFRVDNLGNVTANNIVNSTTTKNITVVAVAPGSPQIGDIWIEA